MKNLFFLSAVMFVLCSCSKDDMTSPGSPGGNQAIEAPHFYGMAMLDTPAPQTRGVANKLKIWPKTMAEKDLTVKFLNGSPGYQQFVRDIAVEWQNAAGVRFHFVNDDQEAIIRIGFDCVPDMKTSWSFTGTDNLQLIDRQDEPTIHFAQWRRIGDVKKRSDALRAFGQALGLELEYRHPEFHPAWAVIEGTDQIDEEKIKKYWMDELAEFISWEELKKMVLDPINVNARFIAKTDGYDQKSVMTWPFYERIAQNIPFIEFDADYNTEFSEKDKTFIKELYGESLGEIPDPKRFFPLIEFDYTGTAPSLTVTTTKNLGVIWDADAKEYTPINMPAEQVKFYTASVSHTFAEAKTRRIVIGEILDYGQEWPVSSTALTKFDFKQSVGMEHIDVKKYNQALEYVRISGGRNFRDQLLDFSANEYIRELYLVETMQSQATVDNCKSLEVFATSPFIWKPLTVTGPGLAFIQGEAVDGVYQADGPKANWPHRPSLYTWPFIPIPNPSLNAVDIRNCRKLKTISLENTRIKELDLRHHPDLEYIYLSSFDDYIVGGGARKGQFLADTFKNLPDRTGKSTGLIVLRKIGFVRVVIDLDDTIEASTEVLDGVSEVAVSLKLDYLEILIDHNIFLQINDILPARNWKIVWDSGLMISDY